MEKPGESEVT
jgi:hypothetical protein